MLSKVVIPVAGLGTRVLPASKAIPKEMLSVVDKPVIQHVVEEAVAAGFRQIILVTRSGKSAIEDHFDSHYELEAELDRKGKVALLSSVKEILPAGVEVISVRQPFAKGLGHAVLCAAGVTGDEDFAVMLPDMLIDNDRAGADMQAMVERYRAGGAGQIMVEAVPQEQVERYGIVDCGGAAVKAGAGARVTGMVEKPARDEAPSNLAIVGRYILPARVMGLLEDTQPGAGDEIQLTDALVRLIQEAPLEAYSMTGDIYDCGNKAGLLQANVALGLKHPETADALAAFLAKRRT
ncbi:UTP--glucose-1-phosphate uridylyltransferase [Marinobacterium nitratireducens]|uniref:UTP--glucose-1-phosphate uridylyltransferase n=1 Tax=Marinobacterium nitratireducens TaxID=518897 RepID=A0A917ZAZ3_9GAMM|nr:UTP--glucose-1-phosphate uridylyltransferase GalU [Marinobacterium nitratireducens]GGO79503.1 UTP--glucose-1-phosphate uridylyltransferase [Marinobacterium nitratireducens]